ncbi:hypothetical protein ACVWXO_008905 [Bradyrhizobium sp. LM2.7]
MRGDAALGDLVHRLGADLKLDALVARADHGGVNRAVVVLLGRRDVVLEAPGHDRPGGMDDAERTIAGFDIVHDNAETEDVGQLLEADGLALHLGPDRERLLAAAINPRTEAAVAQIVGELRLDLADQVAVALGERVEPLHHHRIGLGIEGAEGQVLQLLAHFLHAHAARERRIDVERLLGDSPARFRRHEIQRPHVVQAVGELHQENADVVSNGQQQFAQILGLLGLARHQLQPLQLGQALDQGADLGPEDLVDLGPRRFGVLDRVVKQRGHDGRIIQLQVGENRRHLEGVREIRVARGAGLRTVRLHGVDIGAVQKIFVGVGIVGPDTLDEVILTHHARARLRRARHRRSRGHGNRFGCGLHLHWSAAPIHHSVLPSNGPRDSPLYTS